MIRNPNDIQDGAKKIRMLIAGYYTNYSDGSGQQFITLVSKSGNTFYLVIDRKDLMNRTDVDSIVCATDAG